MLSKNIQNFAPQEVTNSSKYVLKLKSAYYFVLKILSQIML